MRSGFNLSNAFNASVWAVASVTFWSCCWHVPFSLHLFFIHSSFRLGELAIPSQNLFNPSKHISHSILPIQFSHLSNGMEHASFHIPWTKTTAKVGTDVSVTAHNHSTCPLSALRHHLSANALVPSSAPRFTYKTVDGGWAPMTKSWFMDRCNAVWVTAGLPQMPGHAFHIGGATKLLLQGIDPSVVVTQGYWLSRAFLKYWCCIKSILPLFISNAADSHHARGLEASMNSYAHNNHIPMSSH